MSTKYSIIANFLVYYLHWTFQLFLIFHSVDNGVIRSLSPKALYASVMPPLIFCWTAFQKACTELRSYQHASHGCLSQDTLARLARHTWFPIC